MDPQVAGGLISGAGSLLSGAVGSITSAVNTKRTIAAQKEAADLEWQRNKEMWNMQNQYNSPASQMARLEEAGLNPNLVYGSGSAVGNSSGSAPQYRAPRPEYKYTNPLETLPLALGMYYDAQQKAANVDQTKALTSEVRARMITEGLKAESLALSNRKLEFDIGVARSLAPYNLDAIRLGNKRILEEIALNISRRANVDKDTALKLSTIALHEVDNKIKREELYNLRHFGGRESHPMSRLIGGIPSSILRLNYSGSSVFNELSRLPVVNAISDYFSDLNIEARRSARAKKRAARRIRFLGNLSVVNPISYFSY